MSVRLSLEIGSRDAEAAVGLLHLGGALGLEVEDGLQLPPPGGLPLPANTVRLAGHFESQAEAEGTLRLIRERLGVDSHLAPVLAEDWSESWKAHFHPLRLGRIFVAAPWEKNPTPPGLQRLTLEPGMAFGTGDHPTTALCLEALDEFSKRRPGAAVLDVGTGSGILALSAQLLGARQVVGIDDDPVAIRVARENAATNGLDIDLSAAPLEKVTEQFDLILANILANTLADLAKPLIAHLQPDGELCLSGLLVEQGPDLLQLYLETSVELSLKRQEVRDGWLLLVLQRRGTA